MPGLRKPDQWGRDPDRGAPTGIRWDRRGAGARLVAVVTRLALIVALYVCSTEVALADADLTTERVDVTPWSSYTLDQDRRRVPSPLGYQWVGQIDCARAGCGELRGPSDLAIDHQGRLYVVDTRGGRIVRFTPGASPDDPVTADVVGTGNGPGSLRTPEGVFVSEAGAIYVADTGNGRLVRFGADGQFERDYPAPVSALLDPNQPYRPSKLVRDRRGYIYVIESGGDFRGILVLDEENTFRGFFAANRVDFNLWNRIARLVATEQQRQDMATIRPTVQSNLLLDEHGFVYATSPFGDADQIKKYNSIGINVYRSGVVYGERLRRGAEVLAPRFVDVAVDHRGIVSALDSTSSKVFQYDQEGNLLTVIGGVGRQGGQFETPTSVVVGANDLLYVLDAGRGSVEVFQPTEYMRLVHQATSLYGEGRYAEAAGVWQRVLEQNTNFQLAHRGLGRALYKRGAYEQAMREFELADDPIGYSEAFAEWRREYTRSNFLVVAAGTLLVVVGGTYLVNRGVRWFLRLPLERSAQPDPVRSGVRWE